MGKIFDELETYLINGNCEGISFVVPLHLCPPITPSPISAKYVQNLSRFSMPESSNVRLFFGGALGRDLRIGKGRSRYDSNTRRHFGHQELRVKISVSASCNETGNQRALTVPRASNNRTALRVRVGKRTCHRTDVRGKRHRSQHNVRRVFHIPATEKSKR